ncbi:hypothetical protein, partial [Psychromonas sp. Urea-02u-13]|uniref:hypothetical protein n=1 Tax=Psychromonas sp. Urea-02u-13 TaxID=2058326 RepID=UPI000CC9753D
RMPINSRQGKNYAAYGLILKDLEFVKRAFNLAMREISGSKPESVGSKLHYSELSDVTDMIEAFYLSAIISYGKCFTVGKGRKIKLEASDIFKSNNHLKKIHDELINQRHNYVAHAGNTTYEAWQSIVLLDPMNKQAPRIIVEKEHTLAFSLKD